MRALALMLLVAATVALAPTPAQAGAQLRSAQRARPSDSQASPRLIISPAPRDTAVTIYRAPDRNGAEIDAENLQGFALVSERREVLIPAGPAVIRFEGVAGNILPESAVVAGLPSGVREKNMDADLLSPRTLYDRLLGRRVLVRRTDRATGRVTTEQAVIRSSAAGAALVQLRGGVESVGCSGLPETIVYPEIPAGLSAKPTLSIRTDAPRPVRAVLTLSYLAGGFDWQADYTLLLRPDGRAADLFAWVTLASSDVTSFRGAATAVVAGKVNRAADEERDAEDRDDELTLHCWPTRPSYATIPPPPPPPPVPLAMVMESPSAVMDIVVTGSRMAKQEELGDLKLYRFPTRVTVASQAQKQVALLHRPAVAVAVTYRQDVYESNAQDVRLALIMRNRVADGLGAPLPAGRVAIFQPAGDRRVLLDTVSLDDRAVGEKVELLLPAGPGVHGEIEQRPDDGGRIDRYRLTVTNANPWPVAYAARLRVGDEQRLHVAAGGVTTEDGVRVWAVTIPANGTVALDYGVEDIDD